MRYYLCATAQSHDSSSHSQCSSILERSSSGTKLSMMKLSSLSWAPLQYFGYKVYGHRCSISVTRYKCYSISVTR